MRASPLTCRTAAGSILALSLALQASLDPYKSSVENTVETAGQAILLMLR